MRTTKAQAAASRAFRRHQQLAATSESPNPTTVIYTTALPVAISGAYYSFKIQGFCTIPDVDLSWSIIDGVVPSGMEFDADGTLRGTPSDSGSSTLVVEARPTGTGSGGAAAAPANRTFTLTVASVVIDDPVDVYTDSAPAAILGVQYLVTLIATGGVAAITWSADKALPDGLQLSSDGTISGVPTAAGLTTIEFTATDGSTSDSAIIDLLVLDMTSTNPGVLTITTASTLPPAVRGQSYAPIHLQTSGTTLPVTWTRDSGAFPSGITMTPTGYISGIPTEDGAFSVTLTASDGTSVDATQDFDLAVSPSPAVVTVTNPTTATIAGAGTSLSIAWTVTNAPGSPAWELYGFVGAQMIGLLPVTPVDGGGGSWTAPYTIPASTPAGSNYGILIKESSTGSFGTAGPFSVTAYTAIIITTSTPLTGATKDVAYSKQFAATGGVGTITWSSTTLPTGLTMSSAGLLSGTPTVAGGFSFTVTASDGIGVDATLDCSLSVAAATVIVITTGSPIASGTINVAYTPLQLTQTGGTTPTWSISAGALPTGMSLSGGGVLSGTPTVQQTASFTVQAAEAAHTTGTKALTMTINPALTPGTAQLTLRDGTILTIVEGASESTYSPTLGSTNAPGLTTTLKMIMTASYLQIRCTGQPDGMASGNSVGGGPVYFLQLDVSIPGRGIMFGAEYFGVQTIGTDQYRLIDPSDPKHPTRPASVTTATYLPSKSFHMLDGGESIYYRFAPSGDLTESTLLPDSTARTTVLTLLDLDDTRIAAYPILDHVLGLYRHDPATYTDTSLGHPPGAPSATATWATNIENFGAQWPSAMTALSPNPHRKWYGGMFLMAAETGSSGMFRPCMYGTNLFLALDFCRNPSHTTSLDYFLALTRRLICSALLRTDVTSFGKNMWRAESNNWVAASGGFPLQIEKVGTAGVYAPGNSKSWQWTSVIVAHLLRPDDPIFTDAYNRLITYLTTGTFTYAGNGNIGTSSGELRHAAWLLKHMLYAYRAEVALGNAASATSIKNKAEAFIELIFVAINQAPGATKPLWFPATNTPTVSPFTAGSISGSGEGIYSVIAHWMSDYGTNPTRFAYFKTMCAWAMDNLNAVITSSSHTARAWMYFFTPDMSGGGTTWNNPPIQAPNNFNGFKENLWMYSLEPFMEAWYPGIYTSKFTALKDACYNAPGLGVSSTGFVVSGTGEYNSDAWPNKFTSWFGWSALK